MTAEPQTTAVRAAHRFDRERLEAFLADALPDAAPLRDIAQFKAGQSNPTFLLTGPRQRFVLRKKPPGTLLPSAHMVEREYRILAALAGSGVPVPPVRVLCEDPGVIGTPFYVMDHVPGRIFQEPELPGLDPADRAAIYRAMAETLARLHGVDWRAAGLADFGRPGAYIARQIKRWTGQYEASRTGDLPEMDRLVAWLPEHIPERDETTIAHGDFRLGNLILHPSEPRIVAVLDWELSTLGHPLSDLAYNCLPYHLAPGSGILPGLRDRDLARLGIPEESEYIADYSRFAGRGPIEAWPFYLAFAFFRMAAICQGVYHRGLTGNASAPNALDYGARAEALAKSGWAQAESF